MSKTHRLLAALSFILVVACRDAVAPQVASIGFREDNAGGAELASGHGQLVVGGLPDQFVLQAVVTPSGQVNGAFRQVLDEGDGIQVDIEGTLTCLTTDPVNHRAWIGGVVTRNSLTDPDFIGGIHDVGQDVWFRVLDGGKDGDRSTFLGFRGAAGILTSADYCAIQPWPAGNARTWPVVDGEIRVN